MRHIEAQFAYAEQMALEHNARLRPIREHIYRCLLEAEAPVACKIRVGSFASSSTGLVIFQRLAWERVL